MGHPTGRQHWRVTSVHLDSWVGYSRAIRFWIRQTRLRFADVFTVGYVIGWALAVLVFVVVIVVILMVLGALFGGGKTGEPPPPPPPPGPRPPIPFRVPRPPPSPVATRQWEKCSNPSCNGGKVNCYSCGGTGVRYTDGQGHTAPCTAPCSFGKLNCSQCGGSGGHWVLR